MAWLKCFILCSIVFSFGNGFLTQTNPPTSHHGSPSTSQLQQSLMFVSDSLAKEKTSRQQLEQIVLTLIQDMAHLKQQNQTEEAIKRLTYPGLLGDLMSLNKSVDRLNKENQALEHENAKLTLDINSLKHEISALKQQDASLYLKNQLQTNAINNLIVKQTACRRDVNSLVANMTSYHGKEQNQRIGFSVGFCGYGNRSGIMIFDCVRTNYGNRYSASTGKFTCNISGMYLFTIHIQSPNAQAYIIRNNSFLNDAYTSTSIGTGLWISDSTSIVIQLNVGDEVWVNSTKTSVYSWSTHFNGVLISAF